MLALVVIVFAICWFPTTALQWLTYFSIIDGNFYQNVLCHWLAMSSICWNPFIYCWLNESFKKEVRKIIWCRKSSSSSDNTRHERFKSNEIYDETVVSLV